MSLEAAENARQEADRAADPEGSRGLAGTRGPRGDKPRGRILKDDAIYEIAQQQPTATHAVAAALDSQGLRAISRGRGHHCGGRSRWPCRKTSCRRFPSRSLHQGHRRAVEFLKVLLKMVVESQGVAAKVIASFDDLEQSPRTTQPTFRRCRLAPRPLRRRRAQAQARRHGPGGPAKPGGGDRRTGPEIWGGALGASR